MFNKKKTSKEWSKKFKIRLGHEILDPDGWDRKNFDYSFYEEKITREEFNKRMMYSTCNINLLSELGL